MKLAHIFDHHNACAEWTKRESQDWLTDVFDAPEVLIGRSCTGDIRNHVQREFENEGWATNVKIDQGLGLTVFALKEDLAFQLQTGNMSRGPYDLLKLQHLYVEKRIQAAALALPTKEAADKISSNVAHAERICSELEVFSRIITVPIIVVAFE